MRVDLAHMAEQRRNHTRITIAVASMTVCDQSCPPIPMGLFKEAHHSMYVARVIMLPHLDSVTRQSFLCALRTADLGEVLRCPRGQACRFHSRPYIEGTTLEGLLFGKCETATDVYLCFRSACTRGAVRSLVACAMAGLRRSDEAYFWGGLSDLWPKPRFVLLLVSREEWWERKECMRESGLLKE
jgi:hypothetical protein